MYVGIHLKLQLSLISSSFSPIMAINTCLIFLNNFFKVRKMNTQIQAILANMVQFFKPLREIAPNLAVWVGFWPFL